MKRAMKIDLPYLVPDIDRFGRRRLYVRRYKRKIRIREQPGTPAFTGAYNEAVERLAALRAKPAPDRMIAARRGTLGWLAALYFASDEFKGLDKQSQATRRGVIESCLKEPRKPETPKDLMRECPISLLGPKHIKMLRDRKAGLPGAANNRKKYLGAMFSWAIEAEHMNSNPARDVRRKKYASDGFHTWTIEEVGQFTTWHPIGTKAHLALGLLLFLGGRPTDTTKFGRQHVKGGVLGFVPGKTSYLRRATSYKPILPVLQRIIDASPCGDLTFLVTEHGKAFSAKGFGNKMRDWCDQANLHHCTAHGLRKAGATIAAELGATVNQLMSIYDWSTSRQAEAYTKAANRSKMTAMALPLIALGME